MFVLLDLKWIKMSSGQNCITQMAAMKVDSVWNEQERFEAVLCLEELDKYNPMHIALTGYSLEAFYKGETKESSLHRLASWLQDGDVLCVWHVSSRKVLEQIWFEIFSAPIPYSIFLVNWKVCWFMRKGYPRRELYSVAKELGVTAHLPRHCSRSDVATMQSLLAKLELSQKESWEVADLRDFIVHIQHHREILENTQYNYFFTSNSDVFHTRECHYLLSVEKIKGCVDYEAAIEKRRPCKICNPKPMDFSAVTVDSEEKENREKYSDRTADVAGEIIKVRVLGGAVIEVRRGHILGYCHYSLHPGKLTKTIMKEHDCLGKQCPFLEKYESAPFWNAYKYWQNVKAKVKRRKKEQKAIRIAEADVLTRLRDTFQEYADVTESEMDIIRVQQEQKGRLHTYKIFYVSDNRFADGNRFPAFLDAIKEKHSPCHIDLRHIKDVDGHFVTRKEYYAKKR